MIIKQHCYQTYNVISVAKLQQQMKGYGNLSCSASGDTWSDIAASLMEELVRGTILSAVVVSYTEDCVPLVNLYRRDQNHVSCAARLMMKASWMFICFLIHLWIDFTTQGLYRTVSKEPRKALPPKRGQCQYG